MNLSGVMVKMVFKKMLRVDRAMFVLRLTSCKYFHVVGGERNARNNRDSQECVDVQTSEMRYS